LVIIYNILINVGYDTGVMGSVLNLSSFKADFGL
jgi:hypothetical protein